jgi:hypothetical protein
MGESERVRRYDRPLFGLGRLTDDLSLGKRCQPPTADVRPRQ